MEDNRLERYLDDLAVPITEQEEEHFRSLSSWPFALHRSAVDKRPDDQADDAGALRSKYEIRTVAVCVVPEGDPSFSETATRIEIVDEGCGEYVEVSQTNARADSSGKVCIDTEEWPTLRLAIDQMVGECRGN